MVFNNNDNQDNFSESIFTSSSRMSEVNENVPVNNSPQKGNNFLKLFDSFVQKFIEEPKRLNEQKKFIKKGQEILSEYEDILTLLHDSGCNIIMNNNFIELEYPQLNIKGRILIKNNQPIFDDNTNKILNHLSNMIVNTNRLDDIITKHESEGFYPSGDLVKETITLNGQNVDVLSGEMMNKQGQTKKVYYYRGKEVQPD